MQGIGVQLARLRPNAGEERRGKSRPTDRHSLNRTADDMVHIWILERLKIQ
jgi:hypothetical protein